MFAIDAAAELTADRSPVKTEENEVATDVEAELAMVRGNGGGILLRLAEGASSEERRFA